MRVRHLIDNELYFEFRDNGSRNKRCMFDCIREFQMHHDLRVDVCRELIHRWKNAPSLSDDTKHHLTALEECLVSDARCDKELAKLLFFNMLEKELSKKYFREMFVHFLQLCNYDLPADVEF